MPEQFQSITLTLSDSSKHVFTGPAAIFDGGPEVVLPIQVSLPADLPPGCAFERTSDLAGGQG